MSARVLGSPRLHLRLTDSTNSRARELALAGAPHGTIVTAAEQSAGRGRQGRTWSAPAGSSLLLSVLLREPPKMLPLAAAVAVAEVVGEGALIKWPNDVVIEQSQPWALAKVAGILVEGRLQERWAVLGIGLNVAVRLEDLPAELRPGGEPPGGHDGAPRRRSWRRRSRRCSRRSNAAWPSPRRRRSRPGVDAMPCSGARSAGRAGAAWRAASTAPGA